jgi:hypothetical protein
MVSPGIQQSADRRGKSHQTKDKKTKSSEFESAKAETRPTPAIPIRNFQELENNATTAPLSVRVKIKVYRGRRGGGQDTVGCADE